MDIEPSDDVFCNARSGKYSRVYSDYDSSAIQVSIVISCAQITLFESLAVNVYHHQSVPHSVSNRVRNVLCRVNSNQNQNFISKMIAMLIVLIGNGAKIMSLKILPMKNFVSLPRVKAMVKLLLWQIAIRQVQKAIPVTKLRLISGFKSTKMEFILPWWLQCHRKTGNKIEFESSRTKW